MSATTETLPHTQIQSVSRLHIYSSTGNTNLSRLESSVVQGSIIIDVGTRGIWRKVGTLLLLIQVVNNLVTLVINSDDLYKIE